MEVTLAAPRPRPPAVIAPLVDGEVQVSEDGRQLGAAVDSVTGPGHHPGPGAGPAGVLADNIEVRQPSLDDVFFSLTGGHIEEDVAGTTTTRARAPEREAEGASMTSTHCDAASRDPAAGTRLVSPGAAGPGQERGP